MTHIHKIDLSSNSSATEDQVYENKNQPLNSQLEQENAGEISILDLNRTLEIDPNNAKALIGRGEI